MSEADFMSLQALFSPRSRPHGTALSITLLRAKYYHLFDLVLIAAPSKGTAASCEVVLHLNPRFLRQVLTARSINHGSE